MVIIGWTRISGSAQMHTKGRSNFGLAQQRSLWKERFAVNKEECQTHLVCAFWSIMLLRRSRMFQCSALPFHSHSGGRERSHGGCGTKQQSRVFAGDLESNLKGLRFTLVAEPLRRRPIKGIFSTLVRNGVSLGLINSIFCT